MGIMWVWTWWVFCDFLPSFCASFDLGTMSMSVCLPVTQNWGIPQFLAGNTLGIAQFLAWNSLGNCAILGTKFTRDLRHENLLRNCRLLAANSLGNCLILGTKFIGNCPFLERNSFGNCTIFGRKLLGNCPILEQNSVGNCTIFWRNSLWIAQFSEPNSLGGSAQLLARNAREKSTPPQTPPHPLLLPHTRSHTQIPLERGRGG